MQKLSTFAIVLGLGVGCGPSSGGTALLDEAGLPDAAPFGGAGGAGPDTGGSGGGVGGGALDAGSGACELAIHHGHGAAVVANNWSSAELAVRLWCDGVPAPGRSIGWSLESGDGLLGASASAAGSSTTATETDGEGIARVVYRHPSGLSQPSWSNVPGSVRAEFGTSSVELFVTTFNPGQAAPLLPHANIVFPEGAGNGASLGSGKPNAVIPGAVRVVVANATGVHAGQGVANVGIRIFGDHDDLLHCVGVGYTALTDATGLASCDLKLPPKPGEHVFDLDVGRVLVWQRVRVTVTP